MSVRPPIQNKNWAVFISGRGSNLQSLLDQNFSSHLRIVFSDKADAEGLKKARRFGVPTKILSKPLDWSQIHQELLQRRINKIFLLGFMRIIPEAFLNSWKGNIYNIHPSLLPLYPGKDSFQRSFQESSDVGVTLHKVNAVVDGGEKIFQKIAVSSQEIQKRKLKLEQAQIYLTLSEQRLVKEAHRCL